MISSSSAHLTVHACRCRSPAPPVCSRARVARASHRPSASVRPARPHAALARGFVERAIDDERHRDVLAQVRRRAVARASVRPFAPRGRSSPTSRRRRARALASRAIATRRGAASVGAIVARARVARSRGAARGDVAVATLFASHSDARGCARRRRAGRSRDLGVACAFVAVRLRRVRWRSRDARRCEPPIKLAQAGLKTSRR